MRAAPPQPGARGFARPGTSSGNGCPEKLPERQEWFLEPPLDSRSGPQVVVDLFPRILRHECSTDPFATRVGQPVFLVRCLS
jgi:hypothetical protein